MARRTYTEAEKAEALALYAEQGPTAVQDQLGIPKGTVTGWATERGVRTGSIEHREARVQAARLEWAERRQAMVQEIGAVAHMALAQTEQALELGRARDAKDLATTMAILVDKAQLLGGDATSRQESRALRDALLEQAREGARHLRSVA